MFSHFKAHDFEGFCCIIIFVSFIFVYFLLFCFFNLTTCISITDSTFKDRTGY